jgi:hypothetical protein
MQTLHERLAELAELSDQRPDPGTAAMAAARGRAYRRRRLVGTAATLGASAAALALIAGISLSRSAGDVEPAPAGAPTGMPRELYEPSPWLPSTGDEPLGVLAAILPTERASWTRREDGLVGVSATTGSYRFLDLPGAAPQTLFGASISPDGRRVAYWTSGSTRRSPNSMSGPVAGVAVYDSVTGDVARQKVDTYHGLSADGLVWADATTLLLNYGQYAGGDADPEMDQSLSTNGPWRAWSMGEDSLVRVPLPPDPTIDDTAGGRILASSEFGYVVTGPRHEAGRPFTIRAKMSRGPIVDDSGTQVAVLSSGAPETDTSERSPDRLLVGRVPTSGSDRRLVPREVPDNDHTFDVVAWADEHHVVVLQARESSLDTAQLVVVDVRTGEKQVLTTSAERRMNFLPDHYATDLFNRPPIDAPEPPRPWDPRVSTGLAAAVLLTAAGFLIVWRRRARA